MHDAGPLADSRREALAKSLSTRCTVPGVRPGGRVTFFCCARRKSPKKRRLTASHRAAAKAHARKLSLRWFAEATRCALAAVPVTSAIHRTFTPVNAGCTPGSPMNAAAATTRRRRRLTSTREFGVQPTLTAQAVDDSGSGQGQQRERSGSPRLRLRAFVFARCPSQATGDLRFSASLLVTFLWRDREKLLARRGELPARCTALQRLAPQASQTQVHRAANAPGKTNPTPSAA